MKETVKRALRTFVQAFLGYVCAHVALSASGVASGSETLKSALVTFIASALACGLAAVMNLPPHDGGEDSSAFAEENAPPSGEPDVAVRGDTEGGEQNG